MKRLVLALFSVLLCAPPKVYAISGQVGLVAGVAPPSCGSSAELFRNSTRDPIKFDLALSNTGGCSVTLSWTDPGGHLRSITVEPGFSLGTSSIEVAGRSSISWTSESAGRAVAFQWQLERVTTQRHDEGDD
jgi:hypothetical protein